MIGPYFWIIDPMYEVKAIIKAFKACALVPPELEQYEEKLIRLEHDLELAKIGKLGSSNP